MPLTRIQSLGITDGTIVNADINASAAIAGTKLSGAGKVLQVVSAITSTEVTSSSATFADTGLTASITPSSTANKILVLIQQNGVAKASQNTAVNIKIFRGATEIGGTSPPGKNAGYNATTAHNFVGTGFACSILDTPSSISALTYKTQFCNSNATGTAYVQVDSGSSYITLIEIAG